MNQRKQKSIWSKTVIEEEFNKRVDIEASNMADSFIEIIEAARNQTTEDAMLGRLTRQQPSRSSPAPGPAMPGSSSTVASNLRLDDKHTALQKTARMHVATASLIRSAESLLSITSELKQCLILNDYNALNKAVKARRDQVVAQQVKIKVVLGSIEDALEDVNAELEKALVKSVTSS